MPAKNVLLMLLFGIVIFSCGPLGGYKKYPAAIFIDGDTGTEVTVTYSAASPVQIGKNNPKTEVLTAPVKFYYDFYSASLTDIEQPSVTITFPAGKNIRIYLASSAFQSTELITEKINALVNGENYLVTGVATDINELSAEKPQNYEAADSDDTSLSIDYNILYPW